MKKRAFWRWPLLVLAFAALASVPLSAATAVSGEPKIPPSKKLVLDWLGRPDILERYGRISDAIWSYAELGLQEFKSSKLLADALEKEGFRVERGLAGMPTCFVASYGRGRPVIGLLGEYDALPMLSQKHSGQAVKQERPTMAVFSRC